jgi:stearoyl-CoA desaturase (delta-9 desaturase)
MTSVSLPEPRRAVRIKYLEAYGFLVGHLIAALAFFPWFFSWTGVILLFAGCFVFGVVGVNLTFHRLVSHRAFACPRWLECTLCVIGACSLQFSPAHWAAVHRRHHHHTDDELDPHSPLRGFLWAHMGWLVVKTDDMKRRHLLERYAKDLMRDPFYAWIERRNNWLKIGLLSWVGYFVVGFGAASLSGASSADASQFGLSLLVWGAALRTIVVWHSTWSVNSASHLWGYRNYETPDRSRNNFLVSLLVGGEWHNNHHADPRSARQGHKWWEIDLTWLTIRFLMRLGLATNVALPSPSLEAMSGSCPAATDSRAALADKV